MGDILHPEFVVDAEMLQKTVNGHQYGDSDGKMQSFEAGFTVHIGDKSPIQESVGQEGDKPAVEAGVVTQPGSAGIDGKNQR